jgi:DNA mismatch repair ATPase MutL
MNFDFIKDNANKENLILISVPIIFDRILKDELYREIFFRTLVEIIRLYISEEKSINLDNSNRKGINNKENIFISEFRLKLNHRILINAFLRIIKSRGCRDAIKFNDDMSFEFMNNLLLNLRNCDNPFLCAHGRRNFFVIIEN